MTKEYSRLKAKTYDKIEIVDDYFAIGDLVTSDFESSKVMTFIHATETYMGPLMGDGPPFYKHDISVVVDVLNTPNSFYSHNFCRLLLCSGEFGWLPSRWLKRIR